jgi:hypothetical protein
MLHCFSERRAFPASPGLHERGAGSRIRLGLSSALWHATPRAKLHALKLRPQFTEIMRGILCLQLMVFHYSIEPYRITSRVSRIARSSDPKKDGAASCHRTNVAERFQTADAALLALRCWHTQAKIISHQALARRKILRRHWTTNSTETRRIVSCLTH